jgi:signal recognition particle receptor subunit beta
MKQMANETFHRAAKEALEKARKLNDVPHIVEAVNRATLLLSLTPEKVEEMMKEKMNEGIKL